MLVDKCLSELETHRPYHATTAMLKNKMLMVGWQGCCGFLCSFSDLSCTSAQLSRPLAFIAEARPLSRSSSAR
ncbi:hypothetical protein MHYP_G00129190 [Metynnis hypsauchen]